MIGTLVFWKDYYGIETAEKVFINKGKALDYAEQQQQKANREDKDKDYYIRDIEIVE